MKRVALAVAVALALAGGTSPASADVQADKAKAVALFDDGIKNLKAGNYAKACKSLEASNALVPDSGTRGSLARCYTQLGKIASAWLLWRELSDTAPAPDLRADAAAQAKKLEARLSKYVVKLQRTTTGLALKLDGRPIDPTLDVAAPLDAGKYHVEASAPGHEPWKTDVTVTEGKTTVIEVPGLTAIAAPPPPETKKKQIVVKKGRGRRIFGVTLGVIGVGGVVVGGVFGAKASSLYDDAKKLCGGAIDQCPPNQLGPSQGKVDDARSAANISTIGFAAGGALVLTGLVLFVTAPKSETRTVSIAPTVGGGSTGVVLSGSF